MRRPLFIPVAAAALLSLACTVRTSTSSSSSANDAGKPIASDDGANEGKPIPKAEDAEDAGKPTKPDKEKDAKAAQEERLKKALAELEAEYKKEAERWTPELRARAAKLVATKWRGTPQALKVILSSPHRKDENKARDKYRHPKETLVFFGIKPNMAVFEVGPGRGWWTEILAPLLGASGKLVIASYDSKSDDPMIAYFGKGIELMLGSVPELYGKIVTVQNPDLQSFEMGEPESLDAILVMRMTHNLVRFKGFDKFLAEAHATLKPGGILAIEQHRAPADADPMKSAEKGYVPEAWLVTQVEAAGFKLEKRSDINANKKDTKDYEKGVWTLPPTYAEGDKDKAKYDEIGESDRMTLKFVKPKPKKPTGKDAAVDGGVKGEVAPTDPKDPKKKEAPADSGKAIKPPAEKPAEDAAKKKEAPADSGKSIKPPAK
jgi:predicted methyltransferase